MEVERKLCSYWAAWCSRIVCTRSGSLATWTSAYPDGFVGLISDDAGIRANTMAKAQRDFNLLMGLEAAALNDPRAKDVLAQLMWPQDVFTRETFIDLVEIDWQLPLSESLSARLKAFGFANKRTKIQEDLFKVCRKRASLSDAGFCSRRGRWDTAVRSSLIGDYDRKPLQPTSVAKDSSGKSLAAGMFENKVAAKFSLGEEALESLHAEHPSWPTPSPSTYKLRGDA